MRILISGANGLIGRSLRELLTANGHTLLQLSRKGSNGLDQIAWEPLKGQIEADKMEGLDVVVHLAGENVGQAWNDEVKHRIKESRMKGTRLLSETIATLKSPPKVFVCASAIGYYGVRGSEPLDENSASGTGFLAEVCRQWESATAPASASGIRTVNLRFGVVLSPHGGALKQMLPPFQMGAGGNLGDGQQYFSWVALTDAVSAIKFAIETPALSGPVNVVAPNPVTNAQFTKALGIVLGRPTFFPVPPMAARMIFGEMADEMLLGGAKIVPKKLQESNFNFQFPQIEDALRHELNR